MQTSVSFTSKDVKGGDFMMKRGIIAATTLGTSAAIAAVLVFSAHAQTATPSVSASPTVTMTPAPTQAVQGAQVVPSAAPATGHGQ